MFWLGWKDILIRTSDIDEKAFLELASKRDEGIKILVRDGVKESCVYNNEYIHQIQTNTNLNTLKWFGFEY